MLYKSLISTYGASLANRTAVLDDPVWHLGRSPSLQSFREYALDALQQAKVYLMDHLAADYADTLHDVTQDETKYPNASAITLLGEIVLPAKVTWVEFDYHALITSRFERNSPWAKHLQRPIGDGLRGFLFDDRNEDHLRIILFSRPADTKVMDPLCSFRINRTAHGGLNFDDIKVESFPSVIEFRKRIGDSDDKIVALHGLHMVDTGYDLFIPHALFAMLVSPDLGGIISCKTETFTAKDMKTARKFGKSWVSGAQKSHLTIRIGPQAIAHMHERKARLEYERQETEQRNGPVRHWVSEHERRYQSGKIVLIKRHQRGSEPERNLPTRVMGPHTTTPDFLTISKEFPK